jgi:hypothetical protein
MQHLGGCEIRGRHDALASLFLSAALEPNRFEPRGGWIDARDSLVNPVPAGRPYPRSPLHNFLFIRNTVGSSGMWTILICTEMATWLRVRC